MAIFISTPLPDAVAMIHDSLDRMRGEDALELVRGVERAHREGQFDSTPVGDHLNFFAAAAVVHHHFGQPFLEDYYLNQLFALATPEERTQYERRIQEDIYRYSWHSPAFYAYFSYLWEKAARFLGGKRRGESTL